MTQNWGVPNQGPTWPQQQAWNQPQATWGAPVQQQVNPQAYGQQPQQNWPQSGGTGQPGGFAPRPKRNPLLSLLVGAVFVMISAFFMIALLNYLEGDTDTASASEDTSSQTSTEPSTSTGTSTSTSGVPSPNAHPGALPQPTTYAQATTWMRANAIYNESVTAPTDCAVPYINITTASTSQLESHLNQLTACLWTVWNPPITQAGFTLPRPPVTVYTTPITTACGQSESGNAFYCSADQHIYYAKDLYKILPSSIRTKPFVSEMVLAHEFGHTIQARTGILISEAAWQQKAGTDAEANVYSRRTEQQADCFSGLFTHAVSQASGLTDADYSNLKVVVHSLGDDVLTGQANYDGDHGSAANRVNWYFTGLQNTKVGACNTFIVPASQVR